MSKSVVINMAEMIYVLLLCVCHTVIFINLVISDIYGFSTVVLCYIVAVIVTLGGFFLYKDEKKKNQKKVAATHITILKINMNKMSGIVLVILILSIVALKLTGIGMAETTVVSTTKLDKIRNIFDINAIIWIYYFAGRETFKKNIFWINMGLYFFYEIMCGWTGFIMAFFFFELYFWMKRKNIESKKINISKIVVNILVCFLLIVMGGMVYRYMQPIKFAIRNRTTEWIKIPLNDGIKNLAERITYLADSVRAIENKDIILRYYLNQGNIWLETKAVFKPFIPSFIMKNKIFMNISNCISSCFLGVPVMNTSISISSPLHLYLLFGIDYKLGLVQIVLFFIALSLNLKLYRYFENYVGQFDFLVFYTIMKYTLTANLEVLFTQTYVKWIFLFPIFILLGCIKNKKIVILREERNIVK